MKGKKGKTLGGGVAGATERERWNERWGEETPRVFFTGGDAKETPSDVQ